jgi:tRNA pseudouridine55 synthase
LETLSGAIVVDKPGGWTSHDVVNRMRRICGTRRIGHLGTLDPLATGVLPLLIGPATRLARFFTRSDKLYEGTVRFGYSTDSYDADGSPTSEEKPVTLDPEVLKGLFGRFIGIIEQMPPPISAKKIEGVPAYKLARRNMPVELKAVAVEIFSIDLLRCEGNEADLRVHCSGGTYLRSIAHELGQALGCGAFLMVLRRLASGPFHIRSAHTLEDLQGLADEGRVREALTPGAELLPDFPTEIVDTLTTGFIRQGRDFRVNPFRSASNARYVKAVTAGGELVAIGEATLPSIYHPVLVL